ncbi:hypothetical protein [Nocardioides sp. Kera G14]|uniref:hypothetical protein n=1 Tax=Nocardioides sp. Kera G14 TaxID=2884264 RepID=UPI001D113086|nr:hypothetical protein [Nocardioides sp. Kera G14]UDY24864.1 hypothetical protein LH076_06085 [Nocardioides sp. Kera G14]
MRRITLGTLAAALTLGLAGITPAAPASAAVPASVSAPAQRLVSGCSWYTYHYQIDIDPSQYDWLLQVMVTDAGGTNQAFQFFTDTDPLRGTGRFQLCSKNVHAPGRFSLTGELDLSDGVNQTATTLTPFYFQITPASTKKAGKCSKPKYAKHHKKKCRKAKRR